MARFYGIHIFTEIFSDLRTYCQNILMDSTGQDTEASNRQTKGGFLIANKPTTSLFKKYRNANNN